MHKKRADHLSMASLLVISILSIRAVGYQEAAKVTISPHEVLWIGATASVAATCTVSGELTVLNLENHAILARGQLGKGDSLFVSGDGLPQVVAVRSSNSFLAPDGQLQIQDNIAIYDFQQGRLTLKKSGTLDFWAQGVGISADGKHLFVLDMEHRQVASIDLQALKVEWNCPLPDPSLIIQHPLYCLRISPDGQSFATFSDNGAIGCSRNGKILWSLPAKEAKRAPLATGVGTCGACIAGDQVVIVELLTGKTRWSGSIQELGLPKTSSPTGDLWLFVNDKTVTLLDVDRGIKTTMESITPEDTSIITDSHKIISMAALTRHPAKQPAEPAVDARENSDLQILAVNPHPER